MLPRRRKPSPTGKVDRAQPGPDEGKQPKPEKQATLNGSIFHSTWPISLLGCGPSSVRAFGPAAPLQAGEGFFYAIYASRSESFLTIREVMRNSTATKAKKPHWALVVSEVAMKS